MSSSQNFNILTDSTKIQDLKFQFPLYAEVISKMLKNTESFAPFTIVINGRWGSGKTHLLKAICDKVKVYEPGDRILKPIWFNAWKYSKQDDLLAVLIQEIFSQTILLEGFSLSGIKLKLKKTSDKVQLVQATSDLLNLLNPGSSFDLTKWVNNTEWENKEPFYKYFDRYLTEILKTVVPKNIENKNDTALVFFIDDLDRCPPTKVIQVLEIIKLFFEKSNCIFVLGLDLTYVISCFDIVYNEYLSENYSGHAFIEKIINLRFDIPEKSETDFILYIKACYPTILEIFPNETCLTRAINGNIRKLKLFINSFTLFKNININILDEKLLFKFLLIQYVDPKILYLIRFNPYILIILQKYADNDDIIIPKDMQKFISKEYLEKEQTDLILSILREDTGKFTDIGQVSNFLQCGVSQSNSDTSEEISVVGVGSGRYNIGETLIFLGTAKPNSTLFLSIEKPNHPLTSFRPDKISIISKNYEDSTFKRILVPIDGWWEFRWDTQLISSELEPGTYTLHISNGPYDITNINKKPYDSHQFDLMEQKFLQVTLSNTVYSTNSFITINGKVSGFRPKFLAYWIIKDQFILHETFQIDNPDFTYTVDRSITNKLKNGQYFFILQHPMRNERFDIDFDDYLEAIISIYPKDGTILHNKDGYISKSGQEIAELIIRAINDERVDDYYTKAQFLIE